MTTSRSEDGGLGDRHQADLNSAEMAGLVAESSALSTYIARVSGYHPEVHAVLDEVAAMWGMAVGLSNLHRVTRPADPPEAAAWLVADPACSHLATPADLWTNAVFHRVRWLTRWVAALAGYDPQVVDLLATVEETHADLLARIASGEWRQPV